MSDKHTNAQSELLPCPFCGSVSIDHQAWSSAAKSGPGCDDCGAMAESAELWNRRATEGQAQTSAAKPCGWLSGNDSDGASTMYWKREDAQRDCDEHNAYERSRADFDPENLREPEPVYSAAQLADSTAPGVPIYFVRVEKQYGWKEATADAYEYFTEDNRRILYAAPTAQQSLTAGLIDALRAAKTLFDSCSMTKGPIIAQIDAALAGQPVQSLTAGGAVLGYRIKHSDFQHFSGATVSAQDAVVKDLPSMGYYKGCSDLVVTPLFAAAPLPQGLSQGTSEVLDDLLDALNRIVNAEDETIDYAKEVASSALYFYEQTNKGHL
jgi:hypothetical protein